MMLRITYDEIVRRIKEEKGLSDSDIDAKINAKLKQLSGLISKEGAAHIIANELGLKLYPDINKKRYKVKELVEGLRVNELVGKVVRKYEVREYKTQNREGKVASFFVADETGSIRIVLWDTNHIATFENMSEGDVIKIIGGMVRENQGFKEIHLSGRNELVVNPKGEEVNVTIQMPKPEFVSKNIKDLSAGNFVKVLGTVVQVFEPRFYDACPECNRKVVPDGDKFVCEQHGHVPVKLVPIVNMLLDDGTDNIRVVLFRELASKVFGIADVSSLRDNPADFEIKKKELIGKYLYVSGRVSKNDMFDRFELMAQDLEEVDAKELATALINEVSKKI
ncbi:MAG: OB-fold nucleic acid binding domain-containing protein [Candidatus Nanoarchaeia archaeon]